ncbi:MAG: aminotransferase class I/II-fold pyridoxal phosphate-dependent enzyme [Blastochloris viridis]|uniref:Aminotransferase n=1 Tax=Blastochloris viridis TaxID=1079 RepID=A0A6N4RCZ1_BLAVI|nr:MAG: aminotransferase class I/II-fold pyridoxal phosphate-dependent enzyme [Blastochloris viridis]
MTMSLSLATRMNAVQPSAIIKVAGKARELKASGLDVVSLSIGVPGFLPPAHVYAAAHIAVDTDSGDYLPGRGSGELVNAFRKLLERRGFAYAETELCAQVGGKGALFNLLLALVEAGDEVVIPAPYWASYPEMVKIVGGTPVTPLGDAAHNYKITPAQLEASLSSKTKLVIFNNPSNPTGMLYSADEVSALAKVLATRPDVWVISDDIYDRLVFNTDDAPGGFAAQLLDFEPNLKTRMAIVQSISKTYGMPGWRIGMVAAPKHLIDAVLTLTSQSFTNLPAVPMAAAVAAMEGDQSFLDNQKGRLLKQRDITLAALEEMKLPCPKPEGAFYAFPQIAHLFGKTTPGGKVVRDDVAFCELLLEEALVAVVPGGAFGDSGAIRISYAGKEEALVKGLERMQQWIESLS